MRLRVAAEYVHAPHAARTCEFEGCLETTRENKPYCTDHVEHHAYVQRILGILREREAEQEEVRLRGASAVDPSGLMVHELLLHLSLHGSRTLPRLCREFQLDRDVMRSYVEALKRNGLVSLGQTLRGSLLVRLTSSQPLSAARPSTEIRRSA